MIMRNRENFTMRNVIVLTGFIIFIKMNKYKKIKVAQSEWEITGILLTF